MRHSALCELSLDLASLSRHTRDLGFDCWALLKLTADANLSFSRAMRTTTAFRIQKRDCSASSSASLPLQSDQSDLT